MAVLALESWKGLGPESLNRYIRTVSTSDGSQMCHNSTLKKNSNNAWIIIYIMRIKEQKGHIVCDPYSNNSRMKDKHKGREATMTGYRRKRL